MASGSNGQGEITGASELHTPDDIGYAGAPDDDLGASVDHAVEHRPGTVICSVAGKEHLASDARPERALLDSLVPDIGSPGGS
jgi:hypothetical protein